jgi:predicted DNA-binding transcriptional regulator AlpA
LTTSEALIQHHRKLPTPEAANYLGLGKSTLDKLRLTGGGPVFIQIGKRVIYDVADLDAWVSTRKRTSISESTATAA